MRRLCIVFAHQYSFYVFDQIWKTSLTRARVKSRNINTCISSPVMCSFFPPDLALAVSWSVVNENADWQARGFFDVTTLTSVDDPYSDVTPSIPSRTLSGNGPRMWLAGGGYMGQNGNSIVSSMIGYVDMWFSSDGSTWHHVSYRYGIHSIYRTWYSSWLPRYRTRGL